MEEDLGPILLVSRAEVMVKRDISLVKIMSLTFMKHFISTLCSTVNGLQKSTILTITMILSIFYAHIYKSIGVLKIHWAIA